MLLSKTIKSPMIECSMNDKHRNGINEMNEQRKIK